MPSIAASVETSRPCAEVFAFVMTPANAPRYDPAVLRHEPLDGRPLHLIWRVRIVSRFVAGMRSTVISAVTDWQDSGETRRAVFAAAIGPLRAASIPSRQHPPGRATPGRWSGIRRAALSAQSSTCRCGAYGPASCSPRSTI